ncbi:MAG: carboxypeptidase-like regulatory domain-containing protein, partial [Bacteroidetes bacterium]|nr:carboxypeptidase-like regulatory domain-containing protein [Bacteroidota bacterium]
MLTLFLLIVNPAFSQTDIEGTVYDAQSGETLPSATVLLEGTYRGTITNAEGHFSITVNELPATLQIRYIGYESARVEISQDTSLPIDVDELNVSVTELGEIVVTEEDPGLSIMERVIARKQIWRENLDTYQAEAYTRQILSNDTSIVSITESSSIVYWDSEEGHREIQVSRRQTSNMSEDQNFAGVNYQPNFYDDNVEIAGYRMVGITHPDAPKFYYFELEEIRQMDGKPVYKIK